MKELSIEDKAKRYDEAIEKAIKHRDKDGLTLEQYETIDIIFPELTESDDDVMRKMAIKAVYAPEAQDCIKSWGINPEDVISWLEKQGKNNMGISDSTKKKLEDNLNKALQKETPESCNKFLENQGEQIYANSVKTFNGEQNPVWSEDDDYIIEILFCLLDNEQDNYPRLSSYFQDIEKTKNWLKSIKDRVQPSQEWSEKDERIINNQKHQMDKFNKYPKTLDGAIDLYCYTYGNGKGGFDILSFDKFRDIAKQFVDDYGKKSPSWSEEDEKHLESVIQTIKRSYYSSLKDIDWLKSLKER